MIHNGSNRVPTDTQIALAATAAAVGHLFPPSANYTTCNSLRMKKKMWKVSTERQNKRGRLMIYCAFTVH